MTRRRWLGAAASLVALIAVAALAAVAIWWWGSTASPTIEGVEQDHGLELPGSAHDIQVNNDLFELIDYGRSAVLVIDADELPELLETLYAIPDVAESTFFPGNSQYQPRSTPWPADSQPLHTFAKESPAGGAWLHVEVYQIDDSSTGVWLYSDWN
jgi:hypothetical protein